MPPNGVSFEWSDAEVARLRALTAEGQPTPAIARVLNMEFHGGKAVRTATAVRMKKHTSGIRLATSVPTAQQQLPDEIDPVEAEQKRQARLRELREEREAITAVAGEKSLREMLETLVAKHAKEFPAPPKYVAPRLAKGTTCETVVQMLSDWHAGENVSAEAMRGFNEYNDAIFKQRVRAVIEGHLSIKRRMEAGGGWAFEKLIVGANGDFVSGTIHELEKHSDHDNVVWAVYATGLVLAEAIRDLAAAYPTVEVFCTSGNHGRLPDARRMQQKEPTRNWDTLVYLFAREHLREIKNVSWYIPNSYSVAFDVYGWRFLQTHGHDVKSWNSIPWYGLNRLVSNVNALEAGRGINLSYLLFGHFHNASSLPHPSGESFVNGSLIGGNEFALNALGKLDRPTQWMLCVHPEHGITSRWPLYAAPHISSQQRNAA